MRFLEEGRLMITFDHHHYVPILLAKRGELQALKLLADGYTSSMTPIFVVQPLPWDYEGDTRRCSVQDHIAKVPTNLREAWGDRPAFIDMGELPDDPVEGGIHPLEWVTAAAATLGLELVPVVRPTSSVAYIDAVRRVVQRFGSEICLRLPIAAWPAVAGNAPYTQVLEAVGVASSDTHLVLDLGEDLGVAASAIAATQVRSIGALGAWRTLTVAGTSMMSTAPAGSGVHVVAREEWAMYRSLIAARPVQIPAFGDYGIVGRGDQPDIDPRMMSISAKLRYTTDIEFLIAKGKDLYKGMGGRSHGSEAVPPAAVMLHSHPGFRTAHCEYECWIASVASLRTGGGSPGTWLKFGTLHHLQTAVEQVANLHGNAAVP